MLVFLSAHQHAHGLRPALLRGHVHGGAALLGGCQRGRAPDARQQLDGLQSVPCRRQVQRRAAVAVARRRVAALRVGWERLRGKIFGAWT